jgi:ATP-binding cassette subfamily B protein
VEAIKLFVSQSFASMVSAVFTVIAAGGLLLWLNWQLALAVLVVLPIIGTSLFLVMRRVRKLFTRMQEQVDALNRVLNENIVGAALIRLLDTCRREGDRFTDVNGNARAIGLTILRLYAFQVPITMFLSNVATLNILLLGGYFVIEGRMSLGEFTAFNAYVVMLIFPVIIIGFAIMAIGQAQASIARLKAVLDTPPPEDWGSHTSDLTGAIEVANLSQAYGERKVLDEVSFRIGAGTRTAIAGPTAAGKSQLLYLLTGLLPATSGFVSYDGLPIGAYARESFYLQIGLVFQDSKLFNLTLRENIALSSEVDDVRLLRAIETAELRDFVADLPHGLDTIVSERGTSLSGGQKQRIMLARALALEPRILLLDDFTARVDVATEAKILANVHRNYPGLTLVSITQKLAPVRGFDQIILLMDGEVIAAGTHEALEHTSPEYVQILRSQESTEAEEAA